MSKLKNKLLKNAQQKRVERATKKANQYNGGKLNKTQKSYIAGDYVSSASTRAYGLKKYSDKKYTADDLKIEKGRSRSNHAKVLAGENPYEIKYLYDGVSRKVPGGTRKDGSTYDSFTSKKRKLSNREKEAYKKTGSIDLKNYDKYEKDREYAIFRGAKSDGKTFKSNYNFINDGKMLWDGVETAKKRKKEGKHLSNALNYAGGLLKDTVLDPVLDFGKTFDRYESALLGGALGGFETLGRSADAMASKNLTFKDDVDFGLAKKNFQDSMKESNQTGWGKSSIDVLRDWNKRNDDIDYKDILFGSGKESAEKFKEANNKLKPMTDVATNIAGFGMDLANPFEVGNGFVKGLKFAGGKTLDSAKDLVKGTADLSTGIVPKHMRGADDVVENVKPKAPKLGKFLDVLDGQRSIDGRTLNKKRTMTKDGYVPNMINQVDDVVENANQPKLTAHELYSPNSKYVPPQQIQGQTNIFPQFSDDVLIGNNPYVSENSSLKNILLNERYKNKVGPIEQKKFEEPTMDMEVRKSFNSDKLKNVGKELSDVQVENAVDDILGKLFGADDTKTNRKFRNYYERKKAFGNYTSDISKKVFKGDIDENFFKEASKLASDERATQRDLRKFINDRLFNGDEVVAPRVSKKAMRVLLDDLNEVLSIKSSNDWYNKTGEVLPINLSPSTRKFFKMLDDEKINSVGSTINGKYMSSPEETANALLEAMHIKSASLTDNRYFEKLEFMANKLGYKDFEIDIKKPLNDVMNELKRLDSVPFTPEVHAKKMELATEKKRLINIVEERNKLWKSIRSLPENNFDNFLSKEHPNIMNNIELYKPKANQHKFIDNIANTDGYKEALAESVENKFDGRKLTKEDFINETIQEISDSIAKNPNRSKDMIPTREQIEEIAQAKYQNYLDEMKSYKKNLDINERSASNADMGGGVKKRIESPRLETENANSVGEHLSDIESYTKALRSDLKLPQAKINKAKIKLTKGQKLHELPPVKENLRLLRRTIEQEVEMMFKHPSKYNEASSVFKSIKKEYVNALRSYGLDDNKYFHKVTALQEDLKLYYKELNSPKNITKSTGGKSKDDKFKMSLQLLARRVSETFDELENTVYGSVAETPISKLSTKQGRKLKANKNQINEHKELQALRERANNAVNNVKVDNSKVTNYEELVDDMTPRFDEVVPKSNDVLKQDDSPINGFDAFNIEENLRNASKVDLTEKQKVSMKPPKDELEEQIKRVEERYGKLSDRGNKSSSPLDEIATTVEDVQKPNKTPKGEDYNPYGDMYKRWLNSWKKGLTVYNPGWHVQNFFQNKGQNYLGLGMDGLAPQTQARQHLRNMNGKNNKATDIVNKKTGEVYTPQAMKELVEKYDVIDGLGEEAFTSKGIISPLETRVDNSRIMKKLGENEQTARLHHFITKLERGSSPEEAVKSVNKYLYDYSHKSNFDKNMTDYVDPFWTFHKNNAKMLLDSGINNVSKTNNINRGVRGLESEVDEEDRATQMYRGIQSPRGKFKDSKNGDMYNYQYDQNMFPQIDDALPISDDEFQNKMNPLIKIAMQLSQGEGEFGNKIVDGEAGYNEVTKEEALKDNLMTLNPFMNPLVKNLNKTSDRRKKEEDGKVFKETTDKQILLDWISYITGNKGNYYRDYKG